MSAFYFATGHPTYFRSEWLHWTEHVGLSDGSVVVVKRSASPDEHQAGFEIDQRKIEWKSCAQPIALDRIAGKLHIAAIPTFGVVCAQRLEAGPGGIAFWRLEGNSWQRVAKDALPGSIAANITSYAPMAAELGTVPVKNTIMRFQMLCDKKLTRWTSAGCPEAPQADRSN